MIAAHPLRGRDRERRALRSALDDARTRGRGSALLVPGDAGLGKTRLLQEALRLARDAGAGTASGLAAPGDEPLPMGLVLQVLVRAAEPTATLPDVREHPDRERWFVEELELLLQERTARRPLLVALDDLQWADRASLGLLRTLVPRLLALPLVWVLAYRPTQAPPALQALVAAARDAGATTLPLAALPSAAVGRIAQDVLGGAPDDRLADTVRRAEGHPFLLLELLRGAREDATPTAAVEASLPARVHAATRARLERQSADARAVADVAAVLGRRFDRGQLASLAAVDDGTLAAAVRELVAADVLTEEPDGGLAFRHDLVCEALLGSMPAAIRRTLEREAVDVRLAAGARPAEVAAALAASAPAGDRAATALLLAAANDLERSDPSTGADLARRGFALADPDDPERAPLAAAAARLLHAAGRAEEGLAFARTALADVLEAEQQAEVLLSIAWMFSVAPDDAVAAGRAALALDGVSPALRARHLAKLVHGLGIAGRSRAAEALRPEAVAAVAAVPGDADAAFGLVAAEAVLDLAAGRIAAQERRIRADLAAHPDDPVRVAIWPHWLADVAAHRGDYAGALRTVDAGREGARAAGQAWMAELWEQRRGRMLLEAGRPADALAALEGLANLDAGSVVRSGPDAMALLALGRAALHAGSAHVTRVTATVARRALDREAPEIRRHAAWLLALQAAAAGDPHAAVGVLAELGPDGDESVLPTMIRDVLDPPQLVRIALAGGDAALARRAVADAEAIAGADPGVAEPAAAVLHARGLLDRDERALAAAAETLRPGQRPLALASVREDRAVLRVRTGAGDDAVALLREALDGYVAAEASWDAARVRGRLRRLGVRAGRGAAPTPTAGWESLTRSEAAVAELVAQGLSNRAVAERLFVSPHTVSTHLRHAFAKLGVRSRVELARLALERAAR
ncbi:LuxR family transcriptional regulator [Patulibacter sp. SYSU D01012]|uniref:helix-turn-helix transcriptional regulator n=1 Tax=Patulibacter sp. SYSU D01012 TaxID=2817381 RepID=UPI001B30BFC6|nr:LuxR family transcriptional regulator [Patulibacter sp. SYSU D01012]